VYIQQSISGVKAVTKTATIIMRVDPEIKERIEEAAATVGKSLTTFVLEAAMNAADNVSIDAPVGKNQDVPMYFAIHCMEARHGGANGYENAAYHLAIHVLNEAPDDVTWPQWQEECRRLYDLCRHGDDNGIWNWFKDHYPRCMKLVPGRRKKRFLQGVYQAYQDDKML
jgi:Protein of unknown function (DUF1778)